MLYKITHLVRGHRPLAWLGEFTKCFTIVQWPIPKLRNRCMMGKLLDSRKSSKYSTGSPSTSLDFDNSKTKGTAWGSKNLSENSWVLLSRWCKSWSLLDETSGRTWLLSPVPEVKKWTFDWSFATTLDALQKTPQASMLEIFKAFTDKGASQKEYYLGNKMLYCEKHSDGLAQ